MAKATKAAEIFSGATAWLAVAQPDARAFIAGADREALTLHRVVARASAPLNATAQSSSRPTRPTSSSR